MKKLNSLLNHIMCAFAGVFVGHSISVIVDFKRYPELYAMQSAPWYTSILVYGAFTLVLFLVCIMIKIIIRHKMKKTGR